MRLCGLREGEGAPARAPACARATDRARRQSNGPAACKRAPTSRRHPGPPNRCCASRSKRRLSCRASWPVTFRGDRRGKPTSAVRPTLRRAAGPHAGSRARRTGRPRTAHPPAITTRRGVGVSILLTNVWGSTTGDCPSAQFGRTNRSPVSRDPTRSPGRRRDVKDHARFLPPLFPIPPC